MIATRAQKRQRAMSWALYITAGATRNLASWLHFQGEHLSPKSRKALSKAVTALDEAQALLREELFSTKEEWRG